MAKKIEKDAKKEVKKVTTTKKKITAKSEIANKRVSKKVIEKKEKSKKNPAKKETIKKANEKKTSKSDSKSKKDIEAKATAKLKTTKKVITTTSKASKEKVANSSSSSSDKSTKGIKKSSTTKKAKKASAENKTTKSRASKKTSPKVKSTAKPMLAEYYDLPYGYNETIVKVLAQTPTTLFVYWDISEDDRNTLISKYGENFFYESRPILIVHNITKNYSFEIEINDFANSWYIRCQEPNCDYTIELGRKIIDRPEEYIYIESSNDMISPNDHILFEETDLGHIRFRNVKTGNISDRDYGSLRFINNFDKLYGNIYDVYSVLYKDEMLNELENPTSGEFIMK